MAISSIESPTSANLFEFSYPPMQPVVRLCNKFETIKVLKQGGQ